MTAGKKIEARWESAAADKGKCPTDEEIPHRPNPCSRKKTVSTDRALFCQGGLWPGGFWHTIAVKEKRDTERVPRMPGGVRMRKQAAEEPQRRR